MALEKTELETQLGKKKAAVQSKILEICGMVFCLEENLFCL
jgi:hypothetical protein